MSESNIRIGMISWAHVHAEFRARAISEIPGAEIVVIADDNEARGRAAAERWGVADFTADWRSLVGRGDLDVIMVHSENDAHVDQVIAVARGGTHVFCEKPIATSLEDARRMADAVHTAGVDGTAAFVSRFSQEADRAKAIVESGVLGKILFTRSIVGLAGIAEIGCPPDMVEWMSDPVRNGGGAWIDEGSHGVDLLRWLVGDIESVSAFTANRAKPELDAEDVGVAIIRFANGALGEITTAWSMQVDVKMRNAVEIYGTGGTLVMRATDPFPQVQLFHRGDRDDILGGWTTPVIEPASNEPHDYSGWAPHVHHYKREVSSYLARVRENARPFGPTIDDGVACLAVIEGGYRSAREGGAAIDVSVAALEGAR